MKWRGLFQQGTQVPSESEPVSEPESDADWPDSLEPKSHDPYAEKRRRAVELLGERYVLHPAKALHRLPAGGGASRGMRGGRR